MAILSTGAVPKPKSGAVDPMAALGMMSAGAAARAGIGTGGATSLLGPSVAVAAPAPPKIVQPLGQAAPAPAPQPAAVPGTGDPVLELFSKLGTNAAAPGGPVPLSPGASARAGIGTDGAGVAPAPAPTTPPPPAKPTGTSGVIPAVPAGADLPDYKTDPVLQDITNTTNRDLGNQESALDDQERQLLIKAGVRSIAEQILGASSPYLDAITDDPTGTSDASRLNAKYNTLARDTDESLADQGLFSSGARVSALQNNAHQKQLDLTDLLDALQNGISGIGDQRLAAERGAHDTLSSAEQAARDRAIQLATLYGLGQGTPEIDAPPGGAVVGPDGSLNAVSGVTNGQVTTGAAPPIFPTIPAAPPAAAKKKAAAPLPATAGRPMVKV